MSVLISQILSDFYIEVLKYIKDPTNIPKAMLIRNIDKCQRAFATNGLAFDDSVYINITSGINTYALPNTYLSCYGVEYDGSPIIIKPKNIPTPYSVKYYEIIAKSIILTATPTETESSLLKVYFYRFPSFTVAQLTDEIELINIHPETQDAVVDYLLYEETKDTPELEKVALNHSSMFKNAVRNCYDKQIKKHMLSIMREGL